jgi:translocator protein
MDSENSIPKLAGSILLCEAAGAVGSIYTYDSVRDWYPRLEKPSFTPPSWVFAPVWTVLYAMMGLSLYLASERRSEEDEGLWQASKALFGIQLILNVLWSYVFFGRRSPGWALVEILFLWAAIVATTLAFYRISRTTGLLLLPYLLWSSFAVVLNGSIWRLNKDKP